MATTYSCAILSEYASPTKTVEMREGFANRVFNKVTIYGREIKLKSPEIIELSAGLYNIRASSFVTMLAKGSPPVAPVPTQFLSDVYPGYCFLYDTNNPPSAQNMGPILCPGTMGTAYDGVPSNLECLLNVPKSISISLAHQCSYDNPTGELRPKVYLSIGGSEHHVCATLSIFRMGDAKEPDVH